MSLAIPNTTTGTLALGRALALSIARDRMQTSVSLIALAAVALVGGTALAIGAAAGAAGLLALRHGLGSESTTETTSPFSLTIATDLDGNPIRIDSAREKGNVLILGTTGSGKTEALLGMAEQSIAKGSGVVFCDGKGDVSLFAKVYALAAKHGREDDVLVLNMMTGDADLAKGGGTILSNTFNPFAKQDAETLTQLLVGVVDIQGGDAAAWKDRSMALFQSTMRALTWLRDNEGMHLDPKVVRDWLEFRHVVDLSDADKYPDMPKMIRDYVLSYLKSLPGFNEDRGYRQSQQTLDQHSYLHMLVSKALAFGDTHAHVFGERSSDVNMDDVVLNRRILVVMLKALEKSSDQEADIGKIVVGSLKASMGKVASRLESKDYAPPLFILDDVAYYSIGGMALAASRARDRYGAITVFGSTDIATMSRFNERETAAIVAQAGTQVLMRVDGDSPLGSGLAALGGYEGMGPGDLIVRTASGSIRGKALFPSLPNRAQGSRLAMRANHFIPEPTLRNDAGSVL